MTIYKKISLQDVDLKFEGGESRRFSGYASVWDGNDSYGDTIRRGAFANTLKIYGMPKMFFGHKWGLPVGKWTNVYEDEKGLRVEGEFTPGNPEADAVLAALKHGTVDGLSIGFTLRDGTAAYTEKEEGGRDFTDIGRLLEVSIVSFPADSAARITEVRSEDVDDLKTIRDFENFLRDAGGFTKSVATSIVAKAKKIFAQRESEDEKSAALLLEKLQKLEQSF